MNFSILISTLFATIFIFTSSVEADLLSHQFEKPFTPSPPAMPDKKTLNCMVCRAVVDEVEAAIDKVGPNKKVEVGSFRLDGKGNLKQNLVPYARSELHLSELMDTVCTDFKEYVLAHYKSSGRPTLFRLTGTDGNMNPEMTDVDITPDPDVNNKFSYYCQNLVEDYEDDIIAMFVKNESNPHHKLCVKTTGMCPSGGDDADQPDGADSEPYNFEHEDL